MAAITLIFVSLWLVAGAEVTTRLRSKPKAITAGLASGLTTIVAHSGGPPLAMYPLPLGLDTAHSRLSLVAQAHPDARAATPQDLAQLEQRGPLDAFAAVLAHRGRNK